MSRSKFVGKMSKLSVILIKFILIITFLQSTSLYGQGFEAALPAVVKKKITTSENLKIDVGAEVSVVSAIKTDLGMNYRIIYDGKAHSISETFIEDLEFKKMSDEKEVWTLIKVKEGYYKDLTLSNLRYDIRKDLEEEILDYLREVEETNAFFQDEYLTDYLNRLLLSIHPMRIGEKRPGSLSIKVLKMSIPNAFSMSNGTVIVTTGLLSTLRNEEELIGVLAHEVAHFVLDHHVKNIIKEEQRIKRAEFWAGFATIVAAAGEVYMNVKHDVYTGGLITLSSAAISYSLVNAIANRVGSIYTAEQEQAAERAAKLVLENRGMRPEAYSSALIRIGGFLYYNGYYAALLGSESQSPFARKIGRIKEDDPNIIEVSRKYDVLVSIVTSYNSLIEYANSHFETAFELTDRNIQLGVATEDDFIVKNMSMRVLYDSHEKNIEALELLERAKVLNINPTIYLYKQEGLTLLRLERKTEAIEAFRRYLNKLEEQNANNAYSTEEIEWTRTMINKSKYL